YDKRGYHSADVIIPPRDVFDLVDEMTRLAETDTLRGDDRIVRENGNGAVRSVFDVHRLSDVVDDIIRRPEVVGIARQILGSDVYVHQSRLNFKPGFTGGPFYWHSDFETWHAEDGMPRPRAVSCSIALTDNYPFNGGLMVMPGSQRTFLPCVGETPDDYYKSSLKEQEVGVPSDQDITRLAAEHGIDQFTGPAGSALWFDSNIMHGSGNNITPYPRSNIFVVFNSVENTLVEPYAAAKPRPTFVGSRDFTPVTR
ncbi:MAG TPA: ectoine hydroxylase, partial [Amycolatopsis sp.]|uniref:ectoine hydroxylase n=1 Tax=Amycolatopsis sp. TaxID=37632 RepID=UPI002B48D4E7